VKKLSLVLFIVLLWLPLLGQNEPSLRDPSGTAKIPSNSNTIDAPTQADQGNPDVRVWVNTATGVYHCPGSRWYGNTKQGEYMTQAEAQKKHYRPAYGKVCR
jgi:hypothetical protein